MRITLDIPDGIICGFFNFVQRTSTGLQLVSYQLSSDDFTDGNIDTVMMRLAAYEDTGLEPEEIVVFMKQWAQAAEIGGMLKKISGSAGHHRRIRSAV